MRLRTAVWMLGSMLSVTALASAQDSASLGDVARQARQKKSADSASKDSQPLHAAKLITNEEIPERPEANEGSREDPGKKIPRETAGPIPPEVWKSKILAQKNAIASQEAQMQRVNDSIHFASGNCVRGCVQWNERQIDKQDQVERMRANLEEQKKHLEEMEEGARQQGYGGSVYDP